MLRFQCRTSYIICGAQCKMKRWRPLFIKQTRVPGKVPGVCSQGQCRPLIGSMCACWLLVSLSGLAARHMLGLAWGQERQSPLPTDSPSQFIVDCGLKGSQPLCQPVLSTRMKGERPAKHAVVVPHTHVRIMPSPLPVPRPPQGQRTAKVAGWVGVGTVRLGRTSLRVGVDEGKVPDEGAWAAGNPGRQEAQELLLPGLLGSAGLQGEQCCSWDMRSPPVKEERISTGRACPLPNIVKGTEAWLGKPSWRDVSVRRRGFRGGCGRQMA